MSTECLAYLSAMLVLIGKMCAGRHADWLAGAVSFFAYPARSTPVNQFACVVCASVLYVSRTMSLVSNFLREQSDRFIDWGSPPVLQEKANQTRAGQEEGIEGGGGGRKKSQRVWLKTAVNADSDLIVTPDIHRSHSQ